MRNSLPPKPDAIDLSILRSLQQDGRLQNQHLADMVGLSPSPCLRRVRLLEEAGVIKRYVAVLDAAKLGLGMTMFARISLVAQDAETVDHFSRAMRDLPQVVECYIMAGESDALLRVIVSDIDAYRAFQNEHLTRANGIQTVKTDIPMQTIKQSVSLPV